MSRVRFTYLDRYASGHPADLKPYLPLKLRSSVAEQDVVALVDSGAGISMMPYSVGLQLGGDWNALAHSMPVRGGAGPVSGKLFSAEGIVAGLPAVSLIFSWVATDDWPMILGQINFFHEFDILFSRSKSFFELTPRA